jgi:hypothetical protein
VVDCTAHLILCAVFSFYILDNFGDSLAPLEIIVMIWFCSLFIEELRQSGFGKEARAYINDVWNRYLFCSSPVLCAVVGPRRVVVAGRAVLSAFFHAPPPLLPSGAAGPQRGGQLQQLPAAGAQGPRT